MREEEAVEPNTSKPEISVTKRSQQKRLSAKQQQENTQFRLQGDNCSSI